MTAPQDELRAAVAVLRDPCQCLPKAQEIAALLEAVSDAWPTQSGLTETFPLLTVRRAALDLARAFNGSPA